MNQSKIRNFAIIAHIDHGKTSLVDQMFHQSGLFRGNQEVAQRLMDSMDQEQERGITITAKNGSLTYKDYRFNIIDTPGHADFGGQVECVLKMADGVLLLVDAAEGPMPQTYFVLKKALRLNLKILVVINKIDKPDARPDWVHDQVFELMDKLGAPDEIMDFPVIYASAKEGFATFDHEKKTDNITALFEEIIHHIPPPAYDPQAPLLMLVSLIKYNSFVGQLAVGKIFHGTLKINRNVAVTPDGKTFRTGRITKMFHFHGNQMIPTENAEAGEIIALAGIDDITLGESITDPEKPSYMESPEIDPPTISMNFLPNDSPLAGQEGDFVNAKQLGDRLKREALTDIALHVSPLTDRPGYHIAGRGELHLSVLIEKIRREGYEFQVTPPHVIYKEEDGIKLEPYEELTIHVSEDAMGSVIEQLGKRKGIMLSMEHKKDLAHLRYKIPTRGFLGFRSEFMTLTRGMGTISSVFLDYEPAASGIEKRENGVLVSMEQGNTTAFALFNLQSRGVILLDPGEKVYEGQLVGIHNRPGDLAVNACKGKKLTNVRASGSDEAVVLTPPRKMSLENCLTFIGDDELVEVTPKSIRLRKTVLNETMRKRAEKRIS